MDARNNTTAMSFELVFMHACPARLQRLGFGIQVETPDIKYSVPAEQADSMNDKTGAG